MLHSVMQRASAGNLLPIPPIIGETMAKVPEPNYTMYVGPDETYKSLGAATDVIVAGNTIGIRPGSYVLRDSENALASMGGTQIRGVSGGSLPFLDGSQTVSGWTPYATTATDVELITFGDCEKGGVDSRNWKPDGFHTFSGGNSYSYQENTIVHGGNQSVRILISGGSMLLDTATTSNVPAGTPITWSFWMRSTDSTSSMVWRVSRSSSSWLQADGSWGSNQYDTVMTPGSSWQQYSVTFTSDIDCTPRFWISRDGTTSGTFYTDDWSVKPSSPTPSSPNTYRLPLAYKPGTLTRNGDYFLPADNSDPERLLDKEWASDGSFLYMRSDNGTNGNWIVSRTFNGTRFKNSPDVVVSNLNFSYVRGRPVFLDNCDRAVIEDIILDHTGSQNQYLTQNGSLYTFASDNIRISRIKMTNINTDAINHLGGVNPIIEDFSMTLAYGGAADALQFDEENNRANGNPIVRHFYSTQIGTPSPKGSVISFLDNGLYEYGEVSGGHFGINANASNSVTHFNVAHDIGGTAFGATSNGESRDNNTVSDCLAYDSRYGYGTRSGTETNMNIARFTAVNCDWGFYADVTDLTGSTVDDSIFWSPNRSGPVIEIIGNRTFSQLLFRRCIIGPEISGKPLVRWNGIAYNTLADFVAAGGKATNCSSADPQFETKNGIPFQLKAGSQALTMSPSGGRIGCDTAALRVGPRWAPGGAPLQPTWPA